VDLLAILYRRILPPNMACGGTFVEDICWCNHNLTCSSNSWLT